MNDEYDFLIAELDADAVDLELKAVNYGARVGQTITGRLVRGTGGRFSSGGGVGGATSEQPQPVLRGTRVRGKGRRKGKAKQTPEEKQAAKEAQRQANREKVFGKLGLDGDAQAALLALGNGDQPAHDAGGLVASGLATQDSEGQLRLTPQGRALVTAAGRGDTGRARDALSLGKDRAAAARAKAEKAKGSGSGKKNPSKAAQQEQNRADVAKEMADLNAGLAQPALDALLAFADGGNVATPELIDRLATEAGLLDQDSDGGYRLSTQGRRFVRAVNQGDTRAALDALSEARDRRAEAEAENDEAMDDKQQFAQKAFVREGDDVQPGAMIAFLLDADTRQAILTAAELDDDDAIADHVTLVYLTPDAAGLDSQKNRLVAALAEIAASAAPVTGVVNGYGRFVGDDDDALYVNADSPELPTLRGRLTDVCSRCGIFYINNHGFTPHITLTYLDADDATPDLSIPKLPLTFDRIALVWAGETLTFPLCGVAPEVPAEELLPEATLIAMGTPIKSLPNGHIGGYLVPFSDANYPDLAGDFFTPATDFGIPPSGAKTAIYFNHRLPLKTRNGQSIVVKERIGDGVLTIDQQGVFIDAVLYNRKQYEQMLAQMGWSSGTAAHLVDRQPVGKAFWVKTWPLGLDGSLTPTPCSPDIRNRAISLKSYVPSEITLEASPQAAGDAAASGNVWQGRAPAINTTKETNVSNDELKAMLDEAFQKLNGTVETRIKAMSDAVDARLKAFEDSPALKNSGFISMDGGSADKEVKSFADWLLAVKRRDTKRLTTVYKSAFTDFGSEGLAVKDLNEGAGAAGGYLVPTEYEPLINRISAESAIVEPRARQIKMNSASKMVPMLKQTANPSTAAGGSAFFGGLVFYWNPEAADISGDKTEPTFEMIELIARKLTGLTISSNELIEDAPSVESELTQLFGEGLAHAKDFFYLRGDGVGKPLGVLNAAARYQLARTAGGNNVEMADVSGLLARMLPGSLANAIWVSHPLNISDIIQLKIGDTPVFQPDAKGPVAGTLLSRPLAFSEYAPAPGQPGDLGLYDFRAYACGMRRGIAIASSEHARFDKDQTTWRITYRGDGQPLLDATVKLADGANTEVSPFAVLA